MKGYDLPGGLQALLNPTTADRIIGVDEGKRSTKTYISSERAGLLLGLLEQHAAGLIKTVQEMHFEETEEDLTVDEVCLLYPGCKAWREVHQFIVEHYASTGGFSIQATVRMAQDLLNTQRQQADSSITQTGDKPASK